MYRILFIFKLQNIYIVMSNYIQRNTPFAFIIYTYRFSLYYVYKRPEILLFSASTRTCEPYFPYSAYPRSSVCMFLIPVWVCVCRSKMHFASSGNIFCRFLVILCICFMHWAKYRTQVLVTLTCINLRAQNLLNTSTTCMFNMFGNLKIWMLWN